MAQLYFYYSSMNAGKSTTLLQSAYNYREQGLTPVLYTAALDDRTQAGVISSRIGLQAEANTFTEHTNLFSQISLLVDGQRPHCVLVDESQFLSRAQVDQLARVVDELQIPVLCFGIRTDFMGELFAGSERLLAIADKLKEIKTICHCGKKATMVVRLDESGHVVKHGDKISVGGNEKYKPLCRRHFGEAIA
ncbi:thymidine kinase [Umboniibacter marinipuniceus]|uniref:Thymidine kinase n=1 Tax=Umboniibacter marinipuniceus TaxID=569599 RepID=A0A3M0AAI3_9GAMM|nr:thymidine kinase [Umboniibacter marinipuniceus]RMA81224.1 thymidine kinase [Umboniibacter marinipuniceus]